MKYSFKNVIELLDYYKDEKVCATLLEEMRWGGKVTCPHCDHEKVYRTNRGFKCANKDCHKKFSIISGTVCENTKIPLRHWFGAIYLASAHKKGISSYQLARDLGISQKTAWFLLHRIRYMLRGEQPSFLKNKVEVDETFVGGKNINRHESKAVKDGSDKTVVFGALERGGKVKAFKVDTLPSLMSAQIMQPKVIDNVQKGSTLMTDGAAYYRGLNQTYQHEAVSHSMGEYVRGDFHVNTIEGFWSLLKRGIVGIYHQVSKKHLNRYCDEFSYRYNSRGLTDVQRFHQVLTHATGRLTWDGLTKVL